MTKEVRILSVLSFTQIVSYGTLFYAFMVLGPHMQAEFGWRAEVIYGAFSWSILVAGLASTPVGILLDRHGGRRVMSIGSTISGSSLLLLAAVDSIYGYFTAWTLLGIGTAMVHYEAAFATINRELESSTRRTISILTLFGGLASTVFWPLTFSLNLHFGWRDTWVIFGIAHLALCLPAHLVLPARARLSSDGKRLRTARSGLTLRQALEDRRFWWVAAALAVNAFALNAFAVHLIPILSRFGHEASTIVMLSALIGPMQVVGRIGEMVVAHRVTPQTVGKFVFALLPLALLLILLFGTYAVAVAMFCVLYGLGNGIVTILRGTLPAALFGREHYGAIAGALATPNLAAKAAGPLVVAAIAPSLSVHALVALLLALGTASFAAYLVAVRPAPRPLASLADQEGPA